jgi:oligoendopeptidase F
MYSINRYLQLALLCTAALPMAAFAAEPAPNDADNPAYVWDLSDLYSSPEAWTLERNRIEAQVKSLDKYAGTLGKSPAAMLSALDAISQVQKQADRLATYAGLKGDENVKLAVNQERKQAAQALETNIAVKTAWVNPAIVAIGVQKVASFEKKSPELKRRFGFFLDNALRYKPHTLGVEGEKVMATASQVLAQPDDIFSQLVNGELPWTKVTLSDGSTVKIDQAGYEKYRQLQNRDDRKKVFDSFFSTLSSFKGTIGSMLTTQVLGEEFDAKVRHFPNALADAIFADNMPESVYRTLVAEANRNLPTLQRYLKLRKAALGIDDKLRYYDLYAPIFALKNPPRYSVDEMKQIARDVTSVYGPEYSALLEKGLAGRWMNLFPHPGKANGAYMNGSAYDVHPYLLFNNHDDYESLSTFVHEWGHAVHTMLTTQNQPYETSKYSTFVAETASISNELLLNDYLVKHARTDAEKLYYLGKGLELIRTTFFRQVMFAEFQLAIHEEIEKGASLSGERMTDMYCALVKKYYGDAEGTTQIDPNYCVEWDYIPHFYYGFYVYQYATSLAGAAYFTQAIEHEGAPARKRFIAMLKAGGSDYPYSLYKKAGLDMATPAPYEALIARMNHIMDQIEAIQKKDLAPAAK